MAFAIGIGCMAKADAGVLQVVLQGSKQAVSLLGCNAHRILSCNRRRGKGRGKYLTRHIFYSHLLAEGKPRYIYLIVCNLGLTTTYGALY